MPDHVSIRFLFPIFAHLRQRGQDVTALLGALAIPAHGYLDPSERIPRATLMRAWTLATRLSGDPDLPLRVVEAFDFSLFACLPVASEYPIMQLIATSATVGEALDSHAWAAPVSYGTLAPRIERGPRVTCVRLIAPGEPRCCPPFVEWWFAWHVATLRALGAGPGCLRAVRFSHRPAGDPRELARFFGCEVRFGAEEDALDFATADLGTPLTSSNPAAHQEIRRRIVSQIAALSRDDPFPDRVRSLIAAELPGGDPSTRQLAAKLGISPRTLARRFADHGMSHQALLDDVRKGLAQEVLEEEGSVTQAATRLGFADPSGFHRAFVRWFGRSPAAWLRERCEGAPASRRERREAASASGSETEGDTGSEARSRAG
jgi:AraC-like DNA-binding protein